jgi:uncharacterized protein YndB with AHSA1/START domain
MSVRKEPDGRRSVQVETEVPGTVEEVWQAIATGPGVSSWFVPCEMDGRDDGTVKLTFGPGMDSVAKITAWDPPRRFAAESSWGPDSPTIATEWVVESRGGNTCLVRVVHSLFASTDDWDNQIEGTEKGWPTFFRVLRQYLTHHRGMPCSIVQVMAMTTGSPDDAWAKLAAALGLAGARQGQSWTAPPGVPPLAGVIEPGTGANSAILRLNSPAPGTAILGVENCGGVMVNQCLYLYGDTAAEVARRDEPRWREWLAGLFPAQ